ncbi:uncharacterized protein TRIADDRAFT_52053 [Trichoplax adhaerens]|uniref:PG2 pseudoGTPase domain-containing protein n=1 Tax=Trichoplax adhaerens TaxID=10228 RepID=B3RLM3_TRIAD|nr:hypothetical protein TRIADDRAFT_52053 [Trichoplax adhaerens]EDV28807.1 hypothetical protein TRIADDRAFT_52053 [Trichoplax adhaerens]|eukprot:XP_002108009.1 hypothetical protein TRIADDRAFT_52053 [Trichoplax adhaerens]
MTTKEVSKPLTGTVNICVVGLSGFKQNSGNIGVGKSCFCNRFVRPKADSYINNHDSALYSLSDFNSPVVNGDHYLYWGQVVRNYEDDNSRIVYRVIEQTEFIDEQTGVPFCADDILPYHKRALQTNLSSDGKIAYYNSDQVSLPNGYPQDYMPDSQLNIDGFICVFDIKSNNSDANGYFELQFKFFQSLIDELFQVGKPFLVAATKCDESDNQSLSVISEFISNKPNIPLIETSAHRNIGIDDAFRALAQMILLESEFVFKPIDYSVEEAKKNEEEISLITELNQILEDHVDSCTTKWSEVIDDIQDDLAYIKVIDCIGSEAAQKQFRKHLRKLKADLEERKYYEYMSLLPKTLQQIWPTYSALLRTVGSVENWSTCCNWIRHNMGTCHKYIIIFPDDLPWSESDHLLRDDPRIPYDLLLQSDAEVMFRTHIKNLRERREVDLAKLEFRKLLIHIPNILPGMDISAIESYVKYETCYIKLSVNDRKQIYQEYQSDLTERCRTDFIELLFESPDICKALLQADNDYTKLDISQLKGCISKDNRYKRLKHLKSTDIDQILLDYVICMHGKGRCIYGDGKCMNKVMRGITAKHPREEHSKYDIRLCLCAMCCDPYKIERILDRLWKNKKCSIDQNKPEDILIEMPFEGDMKKISLQLTSLHSAHHVNANEFQGFVLIYSTLRLASFVTMRNLFLSLPQDIPVLVLAVTDADFDYGVSFDRAYAAKLLADGSNLAKQRNNFLWLYSPRFPNHVGDFSLFFSLVLSISLSKAGLPLKRVAATSLSSSAPSLIDSIRKSKGSTSSAQKNLLVPTNSAKMKYSDAVNENQPALSTTMQNNVIDLYSRQRCESMHGKRKTGNYTSFDQGSDTELDEERNYIPTAEKIDNLISNSGSIDEDEGINAVNNFADIKKMWEQKSISTDADNTSKVSLTTPDLSTQRNVSIDGTAIDNTDSNSTVPLDSDAKVNDVVTDSSASHSPSPFKESSIVQESVARPKTISSKLVLPIAVEEEDIMTIDKTPATYSSSKLNATNVNSTPVNSEYGTDEVDGSPAALKIQLPHHRTKSKETNIDDIIHTTTRAIKETNIDDVIPTRTKTYKETSLDDVIETKIIQKKETNLDNIISNKEPSILAVTDLTQSRQTTRSSNHSQDNILPTKMSKTVSSYSISDVQYPKTEHTVGLVKQISADTSKSYGSKIHYGLKRQSSLYKSESLPTLVLSSNADDLAKSPDAQHNTTAPLALPEDFEHTVVKDETTPYVRTGVKKENVRRKKFSFYSKHAFRNRELFGNKKAQTDKSPEVKNQSEPEQTRPNRLLSPDREPELPNRLQLDIHGSDDSEDSCEEALSKLSSSRILKNDFLQLLRTKKYRQDQQKKAKRDQKRQRKEQERRLEDERRKQRKQRRTDEKMNKKISKLHSTSCQSQFTLNDMAKNKSNMVPDFIENCIKYLEKHGIYALYNFIRAVKYISCMVSPR